MGKKYLVTGAPGWLGTRFVRALSGRIPELSSLSDIENTEEIRCLVQPHLDSKGLEGIHPEIRVFQGDVTDAASLEEIFKDAEGAILFHLAGIVHPVKGIKQVFQINVEGTKNVLNSAIANKVKRIIGVSSNSPIGTNPSQEHRFNEDAPYNPYMAYGRSKMQMEKAIQDAYSRNAVETVILRPCWFYGPDQPPRQTLFFSMIKNGQAPIVGDGQGKRSMSYVDNTCQALLLAAHKKEANGQIYWIADKDPYAMNTIVDTVERLLEEEFKMTVAHKRLRLPDLASTVAYGIDYILQKAGHYHQKIHVLSEMNKTIACSIAKAERELGYRPAVSLEEGMRRSIQWCLDNGQAI